MDLNKFWNNKTVEDRGYLTPCWIWQGCKDKDGYGVAWDGLKKLPAHRLAYRLIHGTLSSIFKVLHKCDVSSCFNPEHLYEGTQQDNIKDSVSKGRHRFSKRTHCNNGHPYTEENTYYRKGTRSNERRCKQCALDQNNKYKKSVGL